MDNLLDKLRAGDIETNVKRTRNLERTNTSREKRMQKSESIALLAEDLLKSIQSDGEDSPSMQRSILGAIKSSGSRLALVQEFGG
jgi:cytokinesis protein